MRSREQQATKAMRCTDVKIHTYSGLGARLREDELQGFTVLL